MKCDKCGRNIARPSGTIDTCEVKCMCNNISNSCLHWFGNRCDLYGDIVCDPNVLKDCINFVNEDNFISDDNRDIEIEKENDLKIEDDSNNNNNNKHDCKKYGHKFIENRDKNFKVLYRKICSECGYIRFNDKFIESYDNKKGKV
jgi:hypothetical protein